MNKTIIVSNRLPYNYDKAKGQLQRANGGLVSALLGVQTEAPFEWFGIETDEEGLKQIIKSKNETDFSRFSCQPILIEPELYAKYYDGMCNDVLWPLFHYETNIVSFDQERWQAYLQVNERVADVIAASADDSDLIWVHDFHFLMLAFFLKKKKPDLRIGFFHHIPFPSSDIFRQLAVRQELLNGMICFDLIGFHEYSYLRHFSVCLKLFLGLDSTLFRTRTAKNEIKLGVYPISIESSFFKAKAVDPNVCGQLNHYRESIPEKFVILGVDRLDYSKGLELKLKGFRQALKRHPELVGQVTLLQIAVPTRTMVPAYIQMKNEIDHLVGQINGEYSRPE